MAVWYCWSGATGMATGASWTDAFTTLETAISASGADTNGDVVLVHKGHQEGSAWAASKTFLFLASISIIVVDKDDSDVLSVMDGTAGYIGNLGYALVLAGAFKVSMNGFYWKHRACTYANTDSADYTVENCYHKFENNSTSALNLGVLSAGQDHVKFVNSEFNFSNLSSKINWYSAAAEFYGCIFSGTVSTTFIQDNDRSAATNLYFEGCDLSAVSGSIVSGNCSQKSGYTFVNCKVHPTGSFLSGNSPANLSGAEVWAYNCSSGDIHYQLGHYNALGSTIVVPDLYANDGSQYDGTNRCSWKIVTTSQASFSSPYVSPWVDQYHSGTSAITPYMEGLKASETDTPWASTVATDGNVWGEFSYQPDWGATDYPRSAFSNDRQDVVAQAKGTAGANQTSSKSSTDWTIPTSTDAYSSTFKLLSPSITPGAIGYLRARVCVGEPSKTFYVDPTIRGV